MKENSSENTNDTVFSGDITAARLVIKQDASLHLHLSGWLLYISSPILSVRLGIPGTSMVQANMHTAEFHSQAEDRLEFSASIQLSERPNSVFDIYFTADLKDDLVFAGAFSSPPSLEVLDERLINNNSNFNTAPDNDFCQSIRKDFEQSQNISLENFLHSSTTIEFPYHEYPEVSVLLVLHNRAEKTLACLQSLAQHQHISHEIVIVDNASDDQTKDLLRRISGITQKRNATNLHFIEGCNQAAALARGKYLLLLNNDTILFPGCIEAAHNLVSSSKDIGAVGGRIISPDGTLQEAGAIIWNDGSTSGYGRGGYPNADEYLFQRETDYCSGAFLMTPRALFQQLSGLSPKFKPAYYEDVDYCLRLRKLGYRILYEPKSALLHSEHASSGDAGYAIAMQLRNRDRFVESHRDYLQSRFQPEKANELFARDNKKAQRLLYIEDQLPLPQKGSGLPRSLKILRTLTELGFQLSFFSTQKTKISWQNIESEIPKSIETMTQYSIEDLPKFLQERDGYYDYFWVCRPHNMEALQKTFAALSNFEKHPVIIYDVEAFYSLRELRRLEQKQGEAIDPERKAKIIDLETQLATSADTILAVSEPEKQEFLKRGYKNVSILSYGVTPTPTPNSFEERSGILTVAPVYEKGTPNEDALRWFVTEILSKIQSQMEATIEFRMIGHIDSEYSQCLSKPGFRVLGKIENIKPHYDASRIFVAPTRFCSGIPLKVIEAAAHGIPIVCTSLVASQLGWKHEHEVLIADCSTDFAMQCSRLYNDPDTWNRLRGNALERIRQDFDNDTFRNSISKVFDTRTPPSAQELYSRRT